MPVPGTKVAKASMSLGAVLCGVFCSLCCGWPAWVVWEAHPYQLQISEDLCRELGFRHGSPYVRNGDDLLEVFTIEHVVPGGLFDQAGFRKHDIIVDRLSITDFYRLLENARGGDPVTITVVPWADEQPLSERPRREVTFAVPSRH